jgi:phosphoribosylformylglycinamidine (FGAM) synthase-like enzyme
MSKTTDTGKSSGISGTSGIAYSDLGLIKKIMKRNPTDIELKLIKGLLYEEPEIIYCQNRLARLVEYKTPVLKSINNDSAAVLVNKKHACVISIISNHGTENKDPGEGASTMARSVRDIIKTGARPVAHAYSLKYKPSVSDDPANNICGYAHNTGIPVIKSNICFNNDSARKALLRIMTLGIINKDRLLTLTQANAGQPLLLLGYAGPRNTDGKGILSVIKEKYPNSKDIPAEVRNIPDKLLIEGVIELFNNKVITGASCVAKSGIIGAAVNLMHSHNLGTRLDLDKLADVPVKDARYKILTGNIPGTLLISVDRTKISQAKNILKKWFLDFCIIGETIKQNNVQCFLDNKPFADIPLGLLLNERPVHVRENKKNGDSEYNIAELLTDDIAEPENHKEIISELIKQPVIFTKSVFSDQFDLMKGSIDINTSSPSDSGIVQLKALNRSLTAVINANSQYLCADIKTGIIIMIVKAIRDTICSGSEPLAMSLALDISRSDNQTFKEQFELFYDGLEEAIRQFKIPLASFTISFDSRKNSSDNAENIALMPAIGITGELKSAKNHKAIAFRDKGHMIYLIGRSVNDFSSSEYIKVVHGIGRSPAPLIDIGIESRLHNTVRGLIKDHLIISAHNISEGGLFFALLESAMIEGYGFDITSPAEVRLDSFLYSESQGRIIVTVSPIRETEFIDFMLHQDFPFSALGHITKEELRIDDISYGSINQYKDIYNLYLKSYHH